jgi:2-C-methyl-D-erythritol 2,4-cyclodiphosphate synthase
MRTGFGYDIHRLTAEKDMVLGGVPIEGEKGFEGHSDGDVLLHAIADAILGAVSGGDIGQIFPDTSEEFKGISSVIILRKAVDIMRERGFKVGNLDCVVVAQTPKISAYSDKMKATISSILRTSSDNVSVKGKTREKLGEVGRGEAIEVYASVLLVEDDTAV